MPIHLFILMSVRSSPSPWGAKSSEGPLSGLEVLYMLYTVHVLYSSLHLYFMLIRFRVVAQSGWCPARPLKPSEDLLLGLLRLPEALRGSLQPFMPPRGTLRLSETLLRLSKTLRSLLRPLGDRQILYLFSHDSTFCLFFQHSFNFFFLFFPSTFFF